MDGCLLEEQGSHVRRDRKHLVDVARGSVSKNRHLAARDVH